jgi:hypothetical protein
MVDIFWSPNKQLSNCNPDVGFEILKYLVTLWFWWNYVANHIVCLVRLNECGSKHTIGGSNYRHTPLWHFYFKCITVEVSIPCILWIICHQVLRYPSEYVIGIMGKDSIAKVQIGYLHKLTDSNVTHFTSSIVKEIALATLQRKGSRGIVIVSWQ